MKRFRERQRLKDLAERGLEEVAEDVVRYQAEHPGSPAAVRRPRLMRRGRKFIALLGVTLEEGIAGIGETVEAAFRDFDAAYLNHLRPPRRR